MRLNNKEDPARMTRGPARSVSVIVLGLSILLATAGVATALTTGFNSTTYATLSSGTSAGIAFVGPVMYSLDSVGGGLYRTTAPNTTTPVSTIPGNPTSLAVSGAFLYATRRMNNDVIQIDPLTAPSRRSRPAAPSTVSRPRRWPPIR